MNNSIGEQGQVTVELLFWNKAYQYIYTANLTLEKLANSPALSSSVKMRLTGEALFIRAFCYFYLVNLFGDVPLVTLPDYRINEKYDRTAASKVYDQIIKDLGDAADKLPTVYENEERVHPTKWAAVALLARVHLYLGNWPDAESYSGLVIQSGLHSLTASPSEVFLKNGSEAIWQLLPVNPAINTWEGNFILPATADAPPTYIFDTSIVSKIEPGDLRGANWFTRRDYLGQVIYYPTKYLVRGINVPLTEYYMVLRLAEQYLIRAEAKVQQNKIAESLEDINVIRHRGGLSDVVASTKDDVLAAIEKERRVELAAEWGHRWFDLKRTHRADAVLAPIKSGWQATDVLWPIPANQIKVNPRLEQNPGY